MPEAYQYASEPRVITSKRLRRPKANQPVGPHANIMWDKRVVRGSTCTGVKNAEIVQAIQEEAEKEAKSEELRQKKESRRQAKQLELVRAVEAAAAAAAAAELAQAKLAPDLVEIDRAVEEDEPIGYDPLPPPVFVSAVGLSEATTQSENHFFFDFDAEVVPVLQVLVGKTMQLAFNEVIEEQEQDAREIAANDFDIVRNIELGEKQRLEEARRRRDTEQQRRDVEQLAREAEEAQERMRVQAQAIAKTHLEGLRDEVFSRLTMQQVFEDPVPKEIERLFYPALKEKMQVEADRMARANEVAAESVVAAVDQSLLLQRADDARVWVQQGWAERSLEIFKKGFDELAALGLDAEVAAARPQFGELYKADTERKYKENMKKSIAAIKKYFGRAEKEGAQLDSMDELSKLLEEAESLGELEHVWSSRSRLRAIRQRAQAQEIEAEIEANKSGAAEYAAALNAGDLYEDADFCGSADVAWVRPKQQPAEVGGEAMAAVLAPNIAALKAAAAAAEEAAAEAEEEAEEAAADDEDDEEAAEEDEPAAEEEEAPAEEEEPPAYVDQAKGLLLEPSDVQEYFTPDDQEPEGCFCAATWMMAKYCPGLLDACFQKFDAAIGAALLALHSRTGVPTSVLIDTQLPSNLKPNPAKLWVQMLRKGVAKVLGSFEAVKEAAMVDLLHVLTGALVTDKPIKLVRTNERATELTELIEVDPEGCTALWKVLKDHEESKSLQVIQLEKPQFGFAAHLSYKILQIATVPEEVFGAPVEEEKDEDEEEEEVEPVEPPERRLISLEVPEGMEWQGSLNSIEAEPWKNGLAERLGIVSDDEEQLEAGVAWVTVEELLQIADRLVMVRSDEEFARKVVDEEEADYAAPAESLVTRRQAKGQWLAGCALGANAHFNLSCAADATILLNVVAESDQVGTFSLSLMSAEASKCQHTVALPVGENAESRSLSVKGSRTAGLEVKLTASGEPRVVVVSQLSPGSANMGFTITATSLETSIGLQARPSAAIQEQRFDYRWKGKAAGGPLSGGFERWRRNPVWRLTGAEACTVGVSLERSVDSAAVGLQVLRNVDPLFTAVLTPQVTIAAEVGHCMAAEVGCEVALEPEAGPMLIVPFAGSTEVEQDYRLHVASDKAVDVELVPAAEWQQSKGSWRPTLCGGNAAALEAAEPDQLEQFLVNPQFRVRLSEGCTKSRVCAVLCDVSVEQKEKPIEIKLPPAPAEAEDAAENEEGDEEAGTKEEDGAYGDEGADAEEAEKPPPEPQGPVYEPMPGYGFVVVQNAAGGSEESVEAGFTKVGAVAQFAESGEVSITFDADTTEGGAIFVVPCLTLESRTGSYTLMTIGDQDGTRLEPTPATRQGWLAPKTPEPTPREIVPDEPEAAQEPAAEESEVTIEE